MTAPGFRPTPRAALPVGAALLALMAAVTALNVPGSSRNYFTFEPMVVTANHR
jgi:hypothetical protein